MTFGSALLRGYNRELAIAKKPRKIKKRRSNPLSERELYELRQKARGGY